MHDDRAVGQSGAAEPVSRSRSGCPTAARLAVRARAAVAKELPRVEVVCGDAACPASYNGALPADLIVLCGVPGNVPETDAQWLVESLPTLCQPAANVVWTLLDPAPPKTTRETNAAMYNP